MLQKNFPGRKNIRRINSLDQITYAKNNIKITDKDSKETKEYKTNKIKVLEETITNTQAKILSMDAAMDIKSKKFRGSNS